MIGETISHYRILSLLGSGGMGVVFEAEDLILERKVAIKFLSTESGQSDHAARRLQREARTLSSLNHPNICTVYELKEYKGRPYLVEELLVGATFQDIINKRRLDPSLILELAIQLADGLKAAHAIGLVHRDIKPGNLFLTQENRAKILDFGLARPFPKVMSIAGDDATLAIDPLDITVPGAIVGTLDYMSPEQLRGEAVNASSDIFSLGIVLYQLLNGKHPFKKKTFLETASAILLSPLESSSVTRDIATSSLNSVLERVLAKEVDARYADGEELLAELKKLNSRTSGHAPGDTGNWQTKPPTPSVAVLPFVNLSADSENDYFCDGLAEELVGALTKIEGLRVAAWNSAFRFRGSDIDIRDAGQQLSVGTVLEGSLRKSGNRLRVNVKLLDVTNGFNLWSERYDSDLEDVFAVQEQIAEATAAQLAVKLGLKGRQALFRPPPRNLDAYNLYLKGRYFWNRRAPADIQKALDSFQQAAEKDEGYADALAGIADCHVIAGVQGARDPNEVFPLARDAATKALTIEPEMSEAFASLACVEAAYGWNWATAEQLFQKAIALNPQYGTAHQWYATNLLIPQGRFAEGKEQVKLACSNDPLSMAIQITSGLIASFEREPERAIREYQKALDMDRNFALAHYFLGQAYEQHQSYDQAIRSLVQASELSPENSEIEAALARAHAMSGNSDAANRMLDQLRIKAALHYVSPVLFAQVLLGLNRYEEAIAELQRAHQNKATDLIWLKVRPAFEVLRDDHRIKLITRAIRLAD